MARLGKKPAMPVVTVVRRAAAAMRCASTVHQAGAAQRYAQGTISGELRSVMAAMRSLESRTVSTWHAASRVRWQWLPAAWRDGRRL